MHSVCLQIRLPGLKDHRTSLIQESKPRTESPEEGISIHLHYEMAGLSWCWGKFYPRLCTAIPPISQKNNSSLIDKTLVCE